MVPLYRFVMPLFGSWTWAWNLTFTTSVGWAKATAIAPVVQPASSRIPIPTSVISKTQKHLHLAKFPNSFKSEGWDRRLQSCSLKNLCTTEAQTWFMKQEHELYPQGLELFFPWQLRGSCLTTVNLPLWFNLTLPITAAVWCPWAVFTELVKNTLGLRRHGSVGCVTYFLTRWCRTVSWCRTSRSGRRRSSSVCAAPPPDRCKGSSDPRSSPWWQWCRALPCTSLSGCPMRTWLRLGSKISHGYRRENCSGYLETLPHVAVQPTST